MADLKKSKVTKVLALDDEKRVMTEWSKQISSDPFGATSYGEGKLQEPPFDMETLVYLAEMYPTHSSCIRQKVADTVGVGWDWVPEDEDLEQEPELKTLLDSHFESLSRDTRSLNLLSLISQDYETTAQCYLEVVRNAAGTVTQLWHIPSHTIRAHNDGIRFVQVRGSNRVWFKKWGVEGNILAADGKRADDDVAGLLLANEILAIKEPSVRSSFYGIPGWYSAVSWILLALAARDFNIMYFKNAREPKWLIVLENLDVDDEVDELLMAALAQTENNPHRSVILPLEGKEGRITIHRMSDMQTDAGFQKLLEMCQTETLIAHRVPAERVGIARVGALGGNVAEEANRTYLEGVVQPAQQLFEDVLNSFLEKEFPQVYAGWKLKFNQLDLTEEVADQEAAINLFAAFIITLNEARVKAGFDPLSDEEFGDLGSKFAWELQGRVAAAGGGRSLPPALFSSNGNAPAPSPTDEAKTQLFADTLARVDEAVNELLFQKAADQLAVSRVVR